MDYISLLRNVIIIGLFLKIAFLYPQTFPLRILAANVGNATPFRSWKNKLERPEDVQNARAYIAEWKPDIVLLSEIYEASQMKTTNHNGPVLPGHYDFSCGKSVTRDTRGQTTWFPPSNTSFEHECIAWNSKVFEMVPNSALSVYGRDDAWGKDNCNYDFTAHRVQLRHKRYKTVFTAVAVHPNSSKEGCRTYEIAEYWSKLVGNNSFTIIGGDFNTDSDIELQKPASFQTIFSKGNYWGQATFENHYSAVYVWPVNSKHLDHAFANFGEPCNNCGSYYNGIDIPFGVALGGYLGHPRMDAGDGFDHRQILMDFKVPYTSPPIGTLGLDIAGQVFARTLSPMNTNKFVVMDNNGYLHQFDWNNPLSSTNNGNIGLTIRDEVRFRNLPNIDSQKILSCNNQGVLGFQVASTLSNTQQADISTATGLDLVSNLQLNRIVIKPENASAYYVLVVGENGRIGKRPLSDLFTN